MQWSETLISKQWPKPADPKTDDERLSKSFLGGREKKAGDLKTFSLLSSQAEERKRGKRQMEKKRFSALSFFSDYFPARLIWS